MMVRRSSAIGAPSRGIFPAPLDSGQGVTRIEGKAESLPEKRGKRIPSRRKKPLTVGEKGLR